MKNDKVFKICFTGIMISLNVVLQLFGSINFGSLKISTALFPLIVLAFYMPLTWSLLGSFCGSILFQVLSYGFAVDSILWAIPPVIFTLCIWAFPKRKYLKYFAAPIAGIILTFANTAIDEICRIIGYYYQGLIITLVVRLPITLIVSTIFGIVVIGLKSKIKL